MTANFKGVTMKKKKFLSGLVFVMLIIVALPFVACDGGVQEAIKKITDDNVPEGLTAIFGQELGEILLPGNWAWLNPTDLVGNTGLRVHNALHTVSEKIHQIIIQVERADTIDYNRYYYPDF